MSSFWVSVLEETQTLVSKKELLLRCWDFFFLYNNLSFLNNFIADGQCLSYKYNFYTV